MDTQTIRADARVLMTCPVFVSSAREDARDMEYDECRQPLEIIHTSEVVGDDYGSWRVDTVTFRCGHTLSDMERSIRYADEI